MCYNNIRKKGKDKPKERKEIHKMLYARVKESNKIYAPNGVQANKWYQVTEDYCWFGSGLRQGYRFTEFGGQFIKKEYVEVCIVAK